MGWIRAYQWLKMAWADYPVLVVASVMGGLGKSRIAIVTFVVSVNWDILQVPSLCCLDLVPRMVKKKLQTGQDSIKEVRVHNKKTAIHKASLLQRGSSLASQPL